ncbi:Uncharacterised protein [Mycobacteroides abscessus subsp. abscessus]|nr:Uncharacterised protein [Mycobacteroides abscessus subsp. abscessus]SIA33644.1 Uncharacterised protein [Mycobacteroides abscessus subsp. abscessus]
MPSTTVQKMIGAISILISLMKPSAKGRRSAPRPGHSQPMTTPATIATRSWTNSERYQGGLFARRTISLAGTSIAVGMGATVTTACLLDVNTGFSPYYARHGCAVR